MINSAADRAAEPVPGDVIVFPGNPWPAGHQISAFEWTGRLEPGPQLWFDLHLRTADHPDPPPGPVDATDHDPAGWTSPDVWHNYHACTLSSTHWGHYGFLVGTPDRPLTLGALDGREFLVDQLPDAPDNAGADQDDEDYDRAFGIYLLGHDTVAAHRIAFRQAPGGAFDVGWQGRIALSYHDLRAPFDRSFHARIHRVRLEQIAVPASVNPAQAPVELARVLAEAGEFRYADGLMRRVPAEQAVPDRRMSTC
ncbi:hypothetical protein V6U90_13365 [Micromonospora sp. CPCC 206060]|uniref:hypothetical protein n=1 Tax=Micromonospora sp. CPCC 206060 TaxID=3122406 RepID=UPI002FEFFE47